MTSMITLVVVSAILGLLVGSFLNSVILRIHARKQFVRGRSVCPKCGHTLSFLELIPVFSWIALRGRCRRCRKPVSVQYPLVEALTGLLFAITALTSAPESAGEYIRLVLVLTIISGLVVLAVYDLRWYLLPDKVLLPLIIPALIILGIDSVQAKSGEMVLKTLGAGVIFGGIFYLLAAVSRGKWMGGGDIKLAFLMGLVLGIKKTALAMLLSFWLAAVIGLALIMSGKKKRTDQIPFGPFLILGTLVAYWFGTPIFEWYFSISGMDLIFSEI